MALIVPHAQLLSIKYLFNPPLYLEHSACGRAVDCRGDRVSDLVGPWQVSQVLEAIRLAAPAGKAPIITGRRPLEAA
jgi:hypothetical protein